MRARYSRNPVKTPVNSPLATIGQVASSLPDLSGKITCVTGAAGTIGRGIALRFAEAGSAVAVHHRRPGAGDDVVAAIEAAGGRARAFAAELTDDNACHAMLEAVADWGGGLDALVNNAGVQPVEPLADLTAGQWRAMLDATLTSAFSCTQAASRLLRDGGSVTHIASIEARQPAPGHVHYSAAKAALVMHARGAALEYGPRGIRVNTVSPGLISRPGLEEDWPEGVERWRRAAPLGRPGTPEDVGNACVFLASPLASWITGHDLVVDGGVTARPTW
ncbi:3-oxoacyl-[acyl-carrier protein] reductase (EC [Amycolatopsis camponoti]|uniref:3-oxoacyl-[acyl-carrier protein] reductase (EC) n=1 Tax=Amycolatopsis camponoti TaxID=2606593 RepID=A0A6I8LH00_9PSEU|nr:3-oxoacyl-[acyl-carrier protein] reductase (EC [Amycolatopsis camponoti]